MQPNSPDPHGSMGVPEPNAHQTTQFTQPVVGDMSSGPVGMSQPQMFAPDPRPVAHGASRRSRLRAPLKVVLSAVALLAVFAGGYYTNSRVVQAAQANATTVARQFVVNVNAGDNDKAYALVSATMKGRLTQQQFTDNLGDVVTGKPLYLSQSTTVTGSKAVYTLNEDGLPATKDGVTTGTFTISLVKDGLTHWKVDTVSVE